MKQSHLIQGLKANSLNVEITETVKDVSVIKVTDDIYVNAKSDREVVVELELYSGTNVSDNKEEQLEHTETLIKAIDTVTQLLTDITDRDKVYNAIDLYSLGNGQEMFVENYKFKCEIVKGILVYSIKELN